MSRKLLTLLAGALTVVGLPGCGGGSQSVGGGGGDWQPSSELIGAEDKVVYYHAPMLGTPAIQTDEEGAVYNRQASTPYGVRTAHEGGSADEFKFTDKAWDDDLGLIYFGARYYEQPSTCAECTRAQGGSGLRANAKQDELGTWISVDPKVLWEQPSSCAECTRAQGGRSPVQACVRHARRSEMAH